MTKRNRYEAELDDLAERFHTLHVTNEDQSVQQTPNTPFNRKPTPAGNSGIFKKLKLFVCTSTFGGPKTEANVVYHVPDSKLQITMVKPYHLFNHQLRAVQWLQQNQIGGNRHDMFHRKGCLLAMHMGLGKTLCIASLVILSLSEEPKPRSLYICPSQLVNTVQMEFTKFFGDQIHILRYHPAYIKRIGDITTSDIANFDVVITSYSTVVGVYRKKKKVDVQHPLHGIAWDNVFIDESHEVRKRTTLRYEAISDLINSCAKAFVVCMSGTPIFDSVSDIYHQLMLCGLVLPENTKKTKKLMIDKNLFQRVLFLKNEDVHDVSLQSHHRTFVDFELHQDEQRESAKKLQAVRNTCSDPKKLLSSLHSYFTIPQEKIPVVLRSRLRCMINTILKLMSEENNSKIVVYSQFLSTLNQTREFLKQTGTRFNYCFIDENTKINKTNQILLNFQTTSDSTVLFIQTKIGYTGLNLISSHQVIFMDTSCNYYKQMQSEARLKRIGQEHKVMIYHIVPKNSFEQALISQVIEKKPDKGSVSLLSSVVSDLLQQQSYQF